MEFDSCLHRQLDRKSNPRLAYGVGVHFCLGAPHARLVIRLLLKVLCAQVASIRLVEARKQTENEPTCRRRNGFQTLTAKITAREAV
jgi:cytochrome P450